MLRKILAVFVLAVLTACASTPPVSDAELFQPSASQAKVFLYVAYDDPQMKPFFPETFRFHITGYEGEIDDHAYIRTSLEPGEWSIEVDEVDWGGNISHSFTHKTHMQAGKLYFYAAHIGPDGKLRVYKSDPEQGARELHQRREDCNC